jgi:ribonucleoside-diphosphate reductase alpha chain
MYESEEARGDVDRLFETYAYWTLKAGVDLAKERGKYPLCDGSDWSKGIVMGKNQEWFAHYSKTNLDWSTLIDGLKMYGTRFAYHLSPAPNTSTANVVGTTAGLLPIYKKYYVYTDAVAPSVNVAPKLSPENFWLYKEYAYMKMPEVIKMMSVVQKWIDQTISFERIINPADTSPKDLYDYYMQAWQAGIKTVYYVRSMTLDVKECVSCSG